MTDNDFEDENINISYESESFVNYILAGKVFVSCSFENVDFTACDMREATFTDCRFGACNWINSIINSSTTFYGCTMFNNWLLEDKTSDVDREAAIARYTVRKRIAKELPPKVSVPNPKICQHGDNEPVRTETKICCGGRKRKIKIYNCTVNGEVDPVKCRACTSFELCQSAASVPLDQPCVHRGALLIKGDCDCGDGDVWECSVISRQIGKACGQGKCKAYEAAN